jgi:hypothetical protein
MYVLDHTRYNRLQIGVNHSQDMVNLRARVMADY